MPGVRERECRREETGREDAKPRDAAIRGGGGEGGPARHLTEALGGEATRPASQRAPHAGAV